MIGTVVLAQLASALELGSHELVSVVGGGGKTTVLFVLGTQLPGTVVLTTTTKMGKDRTGGRPVLFAPTDDELEAALAADRCVVAWKADGGHKAVGVDPATADAWFDLADHMVVEADGSRRRPFKAPATHEPVVPARTTMLVACIGADALGKVITDSCHRPLRVAALAGCSASDRLTPERAVRVLADPRGSMKGRPDGARYVVAVNQVDERRRPMADDLVAALEARAVPVIVVAVDEAEREARGREPTMVVAAVNLIPEMPVGEVATLAAEAERLGYQRVWIYDEGLATRDVYVTLSAIATATRRIGLGPGITNPYTRHPAQTAAAIASLDELSGGRAFLGIGAGGSLTLDPLAIERTRPLQAVRETIEACQGLLAGRTVDTAGAFVELRGARLAMGARPVEVWLAGRGPRMLALGGALADGVMLDFIHPATMADTVAIVRDAVVEAGTTCRLCYSTTIVTDADSLDFIRPHMTYRLVDAPAPVKERLGVDAAATQRIRTAMAGGLEAAAAHVRDEWILPFVIHGSIAECADQLGALVDRHGIDEFLLPVFPMADPAAYLARGAEVITSVGRPNDGDTNDADRPR